MDMVSAGNERGASFCGQSEPFFRGLVLCPNQRVRLRQIDYSERGSQSPIVKDFRGGEAGFFPSLNLSLWTTFGVDSFVG